MTALLKTMGLTDRRKTNLQYGQFLITAVFSSEGVISSGTKGRNTTND